MISVRHEAVDPAWTEKGLKVIRDYMNRRKLDVRATFDNFARILSVSKDSKLSKAQFRDVVRRERLPFTLVQIDFLFDKIDSNSVKFIDYKDWCSTFLDDGKL